MEQNCRIQKLRVFFVFGYLCDDHRKCYTFFHISPGLLKCQPGKKQIKKKLQKLKNIFDVLCFMISIVYLYSFVFYSYLIGTNVPI